MIECFSDIPEALENTLSIANRCHVNIELNKTYLPKYPTENGQTGENILEELCKKGLMRAFYFSNKEYFERLEL